MCAKRVMLFVVLFLLGGCDGSCQPDPSLEKTQEQEPSDRAAASSEQKTIVFLGDSLTAGYGLTKDEAFPARVRELMAQNGWDQWNVVNAGVSGDTTKGGLERLNWVLRSRPQVAFVCLGANDGLRGLSLEESQNNLNAIVESLKAANVEVLLGGMELPENYGEEYTRSFRKMYQELAKSHGVSLLPFLLEGMALKPELTLDDGIHPNAEGAQVIAEHVWEFLQEQLSGGVSE